MIADRCGVGEGNVLLGNGGDELLLDIMLAWGGPARRLLTAPPSFSSYDLDARLTGTTVVEIPRVERPYTGAADDGWDEQDGRDGPLPRRELGVMGVDEGAVLKRVSRDDIDVVMLASPNNPTGDALSEDFVLALLDASDALVLIDQAYVEFAQERFDMTRLLERHTNLVLLRTFSKAWGLAGVRLGYLLGSEAVIGELCKVRQPYSVDTFSVLAGRAVLSASREIAARVKEARAECERLTQALCAMPGVAVFSSQANFILLRLAGAHSVWQRLYDGHGILLRDFSAAPGLTDCLRVSVGTPCENDEFLAALRELTRQDLRGDGL
jgi:histidinol-phosphate aminotransferase